MAMACTTIVNISRVFTVIGYLLELDKNEWDQPITNVILGLAEYSRGMNKNVIHDI